MNKIKYGVRKCTVFPVESIEGEEITYGEPIPMKGAVSIKASSKSETNTFYADDGPFANLEGSESYEVDFELALINDEFLTQCCGYAKDTNGAIYQKEGAEKKPFAFAWEFQGDKEATRHIFYFCTASNPDIEGKTKAEKTDVDTDTLKFIAGADPKGLIKAKATKDVTGYDSFFEEPYKVVEGAMG